jgi:hypothetical protein
MLCASLLLTIGQIEAEEVDEKISIIDKIIYWGHRIHFESWSVQNLLSSRLTNNILVGIVFSLNECS